MTLSGKSDVPLLCGLLERFNPAIMTAMSVVERPRHVTAVRHSPYVARIGTGVSSDLMIHDVDSRPDGRRGAVDGAGIVRISTP